MKAQVPRKEAPLMESLRPIDEDKKRLQNSFCRPYPYLSDIGLEDYKIKKRDNQSPNPLLLSTSSLDPTALSKMKPLPVPILPGVNDSSDQAILAKMNLLPTCSKHKDLLLDIWRFSEFFSTTIINEKMYLQYLLGGNIEKKFLANSKLSNQVFGSLSNIFNNETVQKRIFKSKEKVIFTIPPNPTDYLMNFNPSVQVKAKFLSIFEEAWIKKAFIMPILHKEHWFLYFVTINDKSINIQVIDSFQTKMFHYKPLALTLIRNLLNCLQIKETFSINCEYIDCPKQSDNVSCGFFMICNIIYILHKKGEIRSSIQWQCKNMDIVRGYLMITYDTLISKLKSTQAHQRFEHHPSFQAIKSLNLFNYLRLNNCHNFSNALSVSLHAVMKNINLI